MPGTPADAKRIQLSRWITDLLVRSGDEAIGDYLIPGESGYTPTQMSSAQTDYQHLTEKPPVPDDELKKQAISLLREGYRQSEIEGKLGVNYATLVEWRKSPDYALTWDGAYASGKFNRRNSNAIRDSKNAQRAPTPAPIAATPIPPPPPATKQMPRALTVREDKKLQEAVLDRLCKGEKATDIMKDTTSFSATRLADWRKNARFVTRWDEAKRIGVAFLKNGGEAPAPEPIPLFERGVDRVVDGVTFAQPDKCTYAKATPTQPEPDWLAKAQEVHDTSIEVVTTDESGVEVEHQPLKFTLAPEFVEGPQALVEAIPTEQVNGPSHYNGRETFDQMLALFGKEQTLAFCRVTAFKYMSRAGKKAGNSWEQDMAKMQWYLDRIKELTA